MSIASEPTSQPGGTPSLIGLKETAASGRILGEGPVPASVLEDRLVTQIQSFERAGYRLETRAEFQAVMVKPRERHPRRDLVLVVVTAGLYLVPLALGARRVYHRAIITVDRTGVVRLA